MGDVVETILANIAAHGPLGLIAAALLYALAAKDKEAREIQAKRAEDAQRVFDTILSLAERQNAALDDLTRAIERLGAQVDRDRTRGLR